MSLPEDRRYNLTASAPPSPKPSGGCSLYHTQKSSAFQSGCAAYITKKKKKKTGKRRGMGRRKKRPDAESYLNVSSVLLTAGTNFNHRNQLPRRKKKASVLHCCVQAQSDRISTGGRLAAPSQAPGAKNDEAIGLWRRERDLVFWARPVSCPPPPPPTQTLFSFSWNKRKDPLVSESIPPKPGVREPKSTEGRRIEGRNPWPQTSLHQVISRTISLGL